MYVFIPASPFAPSRPIARTPFGCNLIRVRSSTPTRWCWPPTSPACNASSRRRRISATTRGALQSPNCARHHRLSCSGFGWTGRSPPTVPRSWRPEDSSRSTTSACSTATSGRPPEWARTHDGAVVELHAYAVPDNEPADAVAANLLARLHQIYPETHGARVVAERVLRRGDCPRFAPGDYRRRPGVGTPHPQLVLAGDGYDRPSGRPHGAGRDDGVLGRQQAARRLGSSRAYPADCSYPRPQRAAAPPRQ